MSIDTILAQHGPEAGYSAMHLPVRLDNKITLNKKEKFRGGE